MDVSRWVGRLVGVHAEEIDRGGGGTARVTRPAEAIVVGGGIAGMSAAVVLAERGVRVTVVEGRPVLGGRLSAWPDTLPDDTPQMVDHGFHAFFRQYYNWRSILRRIDPGLAFLRPLDGYPVLSARWPREEFGRLPAAPPLSLLSLVLRSQSLRLRDLRSMDGRAAVPLLAYHPERTYREFDGLTAEKLLDSLRLTDRARAMLFEVFAHSFFNHEHDMSAAEMVANFHFYFLGNPEGLAFDAPAVDYGAAIWQPLRAHLERHGGRVCAGDPAVGVRSGWQVATASGATHSARHLILAVDPPALRALVARSGELAATAPILAEQVSDLGVGPPYAVARFWFGADVAPDRPVFSGVSRQPTLDSITLFHRLERGAAQWAERTRGSVVELHAYACDPDMPARDLAARMRSELGMLWPETANLPVVDVRARIEAQAPAFRPGAFATRPGVITDAEGLYLAGDGIRTDFPSALMERAAATGIVAANHILREYGAAAEPVWSVPRRGLLARRAST
jgi:isorenieratene synthase